MTTNAMEESKWPEMHRAHRAIVVVDMVESVRLMQMHEAPVIERWRRFVHDVRTTIIPATGGRMVKSLGDGFMLEFPNTSGAVKAMIEIQRHAGRANLLAAAQPFIELRIGAHLANVVIDETDVYGAGVNLAARITTLAQPGQIVATAEFVDQVLPGIDADIEDLGNCWLKHVDQAVRVYRIGPPNLNVQISAPKASKRPAGAEQMGPAIAVIPLESTARGVGAAMGSLIADGIIAQLSVTRHLRVLSRLSTSALRGRNWSPREIGNQTGANYVLSGQCVTHGERLSIVVELAELQSGEVVWADRLNCLIGEMFQVHSETIDTIVQAVHGAILRIEAGRAVSQPFPNLEGYSLLLGGVGLLHRASARDFQRAHDALVAVSERVPMHGTAFAWLAKWHCLRIIRGQTASLESDRLQAQWHIEQALQRDDTNSVAWALRGLVHGFLGKDLQSAEAAYVRALEVNPSEPLAWLFMATLRSWQGQGAEAAHAAQRALTLSPLDPMRYYFESLAAAGFLANDEFERAIGLCKSSLRLNRGHTPSHRVLAISQMLSGRGDEARATIATLREIEPNLTASSYLARYPGGDLPHAHRYTDALKAAGLPA